MFHISIYPKRLISTKWQQYGIDTREIDIQSLYTLSDFPCATVVFMATEKPLKKKHWYRNDLWWKFACIVVCLGNNWKHIEHLKGR